jgi:2-phosphosulfolactate phosphatase
MGAGLRVLRKRLFEGAREAEGIPVVIDVLRAFSSAAYMMHLGAARIVLMAEPEEVLRFKSATGALAVGEIGGKIVDGFDLGNSPARILAAGRDLFSGRTVAQRTSAGVTGALAAARRADRVILGSYVTAGATARYLLRLSPSPGVVSLIAMGNAGREITPDDEGCAGYLEHLLAGAPYDHVTALQEIVEHECTQKFLRGDQAHFPVTDPVYCLQRDLFDFVLAAQLEEGLLVARRIDVPKENTA